MGVGAMKFSIKRYGTRSTVVAITNEEKRGNEFFRWLGALDESKHGEVGLLPTGFHTRFCAHDPFGEGNAYIESEGRHYFIPPNEEQFVGIAYWIVGRRVFFTLHFGDGKQSLLMEATMLQLAIPPEGVFIDGESDGFRKVPTSTEVGAWRAERIDSLLSDQRSQCHIRLTSQVEKQPTTDETEERQEKEWLKVEIGIPRLSCLTINPQGEGETFALMFGNQ